MTDDVSSAVAQQYRDYAYPPPFDAIAAAAGRGYRMHGDPSMFSPLIWPEGRPAGKLRILVAGCGTTQAALLAYTNPSCEVLGLDLSETSLAYERMLKERYALTNLRLECADLRQVRSYGADFDFIVCGGVLHHMADPGEGLAALGDVLAPRGVMQLMLYGATLRTGVYQLQDVMRRLGAKANEDGVRIVRAVLNQLPPHHFALDYVKKAPELADDAAIVDTFLHAQDVAYTVPQLLALVEQSGLVFQCWLDNGLYYPDAQIPARSAIHSQVAALPAPEQWAVVEMLTLQLSTHNFFVRRPSLDASWSVDFSRADWRNYVVHPRPGLQIATAGGLSPPRKSQVRRGANRFELSPFESELLAMTNGERTIGEIVDAPVFASSATRDAQARDFFSRMWRLGHCFYATR